MELARAEPPSKIFVQDPSKCFVRARATPKTWGSETLHSIALKENLNTQFFILPFLFIPFLNQSSISLPTQDLSEAIFRGILCSDLLNRVAIRVSVK